MFKADVDDDIITVLRDFIESCKEANGVVVFTVPYAIYVEFPTEYTNKKPPYELILQWTKRNINTDNPEQTAFAIQNSIFENGTDGVYMLTDAYENLINGQIETVIGNVNSNNLNDIPNLIVENILNHALNDAKNTIENDAVDTGALRDSGVYKLNVDLDKYKSN